MMRKRRAIPNQENQRISATVTKNLKDLPMPDWKTCLLPIEERILLSSVWPVVMGAIKKSWGMPVPRMHLEISASSWVAMADAMEKVSSYQGPMEQRITVHSHLYGAGKTIYNAALCIRDALAQPGAEPEFSEKETSAMHSLMHYLDEKLVKTGKLRLLIESGLEKGHALPEKGMETENEAYALLEHSKFKTCCDEFDARLQQHVTLLFFYLSDYARVFRDEHIKLEHRMEAISIRVKNGWGGRLSRNNLIICSILQKKNLALERLKKTDENGSEASLLRQLVQEAESKARLFSLDPLFSTTGYANLECNHEYLLKESG